jgi:hypothetical protein
MAAMRIRVTQECINDGVQCDCRACPVALAIRRKYPKRDVSVYRDEMLLRHPYRKISLPQRACDFITAFDEGMPIKPFSFELKI